MITPERETSVIDASDHTQNEQEVIRMQARVATQASVHMPYAATSDQDVSYEPGVPTTARWELIA